MRSELCHYRRKVKCYYGVMFVSRNEWHVSLHINVTSSPPFPHGLRPNIPTPPKPFQVPILMHSNHNYMSLKRSVLFNLIIMLKVLHECLNN